MKVPLAVSAIISASQATQLLADPITTTGAFGVAVQEFKYDEFIHRILDFPGDTSYY
jgi:hypothetical protein